MQKDDKTIIFFVGLFLIVGLLGELLFYLDIRQFGFITRTAVGVGRLGGLFLLLRQGTFIKSKNNLRLTIFFLGILFIGALLKIKHWPYSNITFLIGLIGIVTIYTLHFSKKHDKQRLDILKLIWLTVFCMAIIFEAQHFPFRHELKIIEGLLFLLMFADFFFTHYRLDSSGQIQDKKINGGQ